MNSEEFKKLWIGRSFRCSDTGITVTLTDDNVYPRAFICVGNGFIDLGDGVYCRYGGNIQEIKDSLNEDIKKDYNETITTKEI